MKTYEVYVRPLASSKRNLAMIYANRQYAEKCAKEYQEKGYSTEIEEHYYDL